MHEASLLKDLMNKIQTIAMTEQSPRVLRVHLKLGALAHISPDHLREHFVEAAQGTVAEGADLVIAQQDDIEDKHAQDILLDSIELES